MRLFKVVFFLVLVFAAFSVHAQSSAELKRQREALTQQ
jgi:uncharacterized membrane protein YphA (DoxX/SURF4 family)